jgi:bifunctional DNA-binding transcriptional regulator/antitoxin component of YhaV-PrlF toxin-antitoxin module
MSQRTSVAPKKRISVSQKRQITIPVEFFNSLGIQSEVDCYMQDNQIIIRPAQDSGEFDEQILADLISQGYSGEELLAQFKEYRRRIRPAVERLIEEADKAARGEGEFSTLAELFEGDD